MFICSVVHHAKIVRRVRIITVRHNQVCVAAPWLMNMSGSDLLSRATRIGYNDIDCVKLRKPTKKHEVRNKTPLQLFLLLRMTLQKNKRVQCRHMHVLLSKHTAKHVHAHICICIHGETDRERDREKDRAKARKHEHKNIDQNIRSVHLFPRHLFAFQIMIIMTNMYTCMMYDRVGMGSFMTYINIFMYIYIFI